MLLSSISTLGSVSRRRFLQSASLLGLSSLVFDSRAYEPLAEEEIEVSSHTIRIKNLPSAFNGLKVVQLSDIHHSKYVSFNDVYRMVELANCQNPDVVFLTGDYVTWSRKYISPVAEALKSLKSRLGVFAVLGNHDFRVDADQMARALKEVQIQVLRNSASRIERHGHFLWVAGVDEFSYGRSDLARAFAPVPPWHPRILLAHHPEIFPEAASRQIDLVLSGHTHGGQVRIPYLRSLHSMTQPSQETLEGFIREGQTQMYISRGLGKVVLPFRILCPPEIPVFHLRQKV